MKLDLNIGDIILTGRFKNKPVEVKEFGTDEKGQPTINGRPILKFRIKKLIPENTKMDKKRIQQIIKEEVAGDLKEQAPRMKKNAAEDEVAKTIKNIERIENGIRAFDSSAYSHIKGDFKKAIKALDNLKFKIRRHG